MKKIKKKADFLGISLAILGLSLFGAGAASAWGPERPTFTMENPASYPTFNSITNNPTIGDERNFVRVGEIDAEGTDLSDTVEGVPGRQYLVYIYFHNNASATYNSSAYNNVGVALRTRMSSSFSTVLTPENSGTITATITADNSNPTSVWDEAYMTTSTDKVLMHYVAGSAKIYNDWGANGSVMPSSLFTEEGTLLGLNALNGVIPGCEEYHGVVTYVLQAEELGGSIEKKVSTDGENYAESVAVAPGSEVYFQLTVHNTGDVALTNAIVKDSLPEGLALIPGSVKLRANDSTVVDTLSDNIIDAGYNLGTIGRGNTIYLTYRATVQGEYDCDGKDLLNNATLTYDSEVGSGDMKSDSANVNVKKDDCEEEPVPLDTCETNPGMEGCEKNCKTNPEMEGCQELPSTGPLEIIMAIVVIAGLSGGAYYLYRSNKTLKTVESVAKGDDAVKNEGTTKGDDTIKELTAKKDDVPKEEK